MLPLIIIPRLLYIQHLLPGHDPVHQKPFTTFKTNTAENEWVIDSFINN